MLYRRWIEPISTDNRDLIIVPCTLIERVMYSYHNTMEACHAGVDACTNKCMRDFYFYKMKKEFGLYISSCVLCAKTRQPTAYLRAPMKNVVCTSFNSCISVDHLEPTKFRTPRGNTALLTICDVFTGYIVCVGVR